MKKLIVFLSGFIILFLGGCAKDEPLSNKDSSFTVNGTKINNILYTLCEISSFSKEMILEVHFGYDNTTYSLNMAIPSIKSLDDIVVGDKFDSDEFEINKFYSMGGVFVGKENYEPLSGYAIVKSISSKALVLEYSNFKFLRQLGSKEETFMVNGTISHKIYD